MSLRSDAELANTRAKLKRLETRYEALRQDATEDAHVRELTLRSLRATINQFKEEIARYEACRSKPREAARS
jgi:hypothetical protein